QIGLGRCAREGVYPQRYSTDWATKPQAHFSAPRRAACLLGGGVVARSSQIHFGICSSLAPSLRPKSIAANVKLFRRHHTSWSEFTQTALIVLQPDLRKSWTPATIGRLLQGSQ